MKKLKKVLTNGNGFSIISWQSKNGCIDMREWRNWQTRTFEGRVVHTVRVQVPSLAPKHSNPNLLPIGETFGFVVFLNDVK